jgi:hypothetical protein
MTMYLHYWYKGNGLGSKAPGSPFQTQSLHRNCSSSVKGSDNISMRSTLINLHRPLDMVPYTYPSRRTEGRSCLTQGRLAIRTKLRGSSEGETISHWAESMSFVSVPPVTWLMMNNIDTPHVWHLLETLGQFVIQYLNFLSTFLYISCCVRCCSAALQTSQSVLLLLSATLYKSFACYLDWWWTFQQE